MIFILKSNWLILLDIFPIIENKLHKIALLKKTTKYNRWSKKEVKFSLLIKFGLF